VFFGKIEFQICFNNRSERIKNQHVDEKMQPSGMKKAVSEESVPLVAVLYIIGIELQFVKKFNVIQTQKGNQDS
jgi:hypothetical protein